MLCNSDIRTAALESMLNIKVTESEEAERQRLMELSKDELIEQYLKAKVNGQFYISYVC